MKEKEKQLKELKETVKSSFTQLWEAMEKENEKLITNINDMFIKLKNK